MNILPGDRAGCENGSPAAVLRLYIAGYTQRANNSILVVRELCQKYLQGRCQLDIIDISQQPELARRDQIIATPTLIKIQPRPKRILIGALSTSEALLQDLGLAK